MCDFFSWVEICDDDEEIKGLNKTIKQLRDKIPFISKPVRSTNKIYYLTDDIITSKYGEDACIEDNVGHEAIIKFFRGTFPEVRDGMHRESIEYIDPRIVPEINKGDMRKMLKAFNPNILEVKYDSKGRLIKKVVKDDENNKKFVAGQYYKWVGSNKRPNRWNNSGKMDAMLSGKPFKCASLDHFNDPIFNEIPRDDNNTIGWSWLRKYDEGSIVRCYINGIVKETTIVTTYYTYITGIRFATKVKE
jgi:hypothetical protein